MSNHVSGQKYSSFEMRGNEAVKLNSIAAPPNFVRFGTRIVYAPQTTDVILLVLNFKHVYFGFHICE